MKLNHCNIMLRTIVLIIASIFINSSWAEHDASNKIRLAPANDIIGMDIRSSDGKEAGEIEYLLIDGVSAEVRYALIKEDGELDLEYGELVALPFDNLDFKRIDDDKVSVRASLEKLRGATRITKDSISELIKPVVITEVYDYYMTPESNQAESSSKDKNKSQQDEAKSLKSDDKENKETHHVLIARDVVETIIPGMRRADRMRGAEVRTQADKDFGEIDQLVLDLDNARVAYALVDHGGFLGIGGEWVAIPLERLIWMEEDQAYLADFNADSSADQVKRIPKTDLPVNVGKKDLDRFYQGFGMDSYPAGSSSKDALKNKDK